MNPRISRPLAVAVLAVTFGALGAGSAAAVPAATPIVGSVAVCLPIPIGALAVNLCV